MPQINEIAFAKALSSLQGYRPVSEDIVRNAIEDFLRTRSYPGAETSQDCVLAYERVLGDLEVPREIHGSMLYQGGDQRLILHIPLGVAQSIFQDDSDRDFRDAVYRLFAEIHEGSNPAWSDQDAESYMVEMSPASGRMRNLRIEMFAALVQEQAKRNK